MGGAPPPLHHLLRRSRYDPMTMNENTSTLGTLGKRVIAWIVIAVVAVLLVKLLIGTVVGIVTTLLTLVLVAAAIAAIVWAVRGL